MLRLAHNRLAMLPASIGGLTRLKGFYLDFNRLSRLPEEIGELKLLEELNLELTLTLTLTPTPTPTPALTLTPTRSSTWRTTSSRSCPSPCTREASRA